MRNLFLYFTIACAAACNTTPFSPGSGDSEPNSDSPVDANKIRFSFGLRNFREINAIMHSKVGPANVKPSTGNKDSAKVPVAASAATSCEKNSEGGWHHNTFVGKVWCSGVKDLLPKSSNVLSLTGPTQVGIFKLASTYCKELMQDNDNGEQARTQRLPTVATQLNAIKMSQRPADIDTALQNSIAAAFVDHFHDTQTVRPDAETTKSDLAELMADLISTQEEKGNKQASNQEVLVGACSAALASAQMMFH